MIKGYINQNNITVDRVKSKKVLLIGLGGEVKVEPNIDGDRSVLFKSNIAGAFLFNDKMSKNRGTEDAVLNRLKMPETRRQVNKNPDYVKLISWRVI